MIRRTVPFAVLLLAACGGGSDSPSTNVSNSPAPAPAPSTNPSPAPAPLPPQIIVVQPPATEPAPTPVASPSPSPSPAPVAAPAPDPARTLGASYAETTLKCGTGLPWWPTSDHAVSYFDGQVHLRANGQSWRFQVDASSADQVNPHAEGTDWFQNSFGERAWITISLDGRIIGAGHHGANEQSHVACGVQLKWLQQHPGSVVPQNAPARVLTCTETVEGRVSTYPLLLQFQGGRLTGSNGFAPGEFLPLPAAIGGVPPVSAGVNRTLYRGGTTPAESVVVDAAGVVVGFNGYPRQTTSLVCR